MKPWHFVLSLSACTASCRDHWWRVRRPRRGAHARVTLIDRHNYHLFQPLLYQVATASLSPGDVASPIRWILRHQKNVKVLLADVRGIDVAATRVLLDAGGNEGEAAVDYDYLIIATGAAH